ncbi:MAG: hypothetical protein JO092_03950 [Candidatus Eremiobacteraeota bacterium]|nr:hypothetical protein [Candidatus Eremiobacteraeota bacterium]
MDFATSGLLTGEGLMRRLAVAFVILSFAAVLAACGDTGDHFLDFAKTPPTPVVVQSMLITMPIVPGPGNRGGKFKLYLTAYNAGKAIRQGTQLQNPIILNTNYTGFVKFGGPNGPFASGRTYQSAPGPITVEYTRPADPCSPVVGITAFNHDASPTLATFNLVQGCHAHPTPTPSTGPTTSPTTKPTKSPKPTPTPTGPPSPTVAKLSLAVPGPTPNPLSPGTFAMVVTAFNSAAQTIPPGTTLTQPIILTSNSSCSVTFSFAGASGTTLTLTTAPGAVTFTYTPPSAGCTPPNPILITAFSNTATPQTTNFSLLGGTATVTGLAIAPLAVPDPVSEGVYPMFVTANASYGTIPLGVTLNNPVQWSSNYACGVGFGDTNNPGSFTPTFRQTSTLTQVYFEFNPTNPSKCPPPAAGRVIITVLANGSPQVSATYSYPF